MTTEKAMDLCFNCDKNIHLNHTREELERCVKALGNKYGSLLIKNLDRNDDEV